MPDNSLPSKHQPQAVQKFKQFIEEQSAASVEVDPGDILKLPQSWASKVEFNYVSPDGEDVYVGVLEGDKSLLRLRRGHLDSAGRLQWDSAEETRYVPQACQEFQIWAKDSGSAGNDSCEKNSGIPDISTPKYSAISWIGLGSASLLEASAGGLGFLFNLDQKFDQSFKNWLLNSYSTEKWRPVPSRASSRFLFRSPALLMGASSMAFSGSVADAIGWHPEYHRLERNALGAYMAQRGMGLQTGVVGFFSIIPPGFKQLPEINSRLSASFGSRLLSSRLVEATVGKVFDSGSMAGEAARMAGFFAPDLLLLGLGRNRLSFLDRPKARLTSGWFNRLMIAGFVADLGFMAYNHGKEGESGSALKHRVLQRANELQSAEQDLGSAFFKGAANLVLPAISEEALVEEKYLRQAKEENLQASELAAIRSFLLSSILVGDPLSSAQADFYDRIDLSWLQGPNRLGDIRLDFQRTFSLDLLANDLKDPAFGSKFKAMNSVEQVELIRRQYRGYDLSQAEAQFLLARLATFQIRKRIGELKYFGGDEKSMLLRCFDREGALIPNMRGRLLQEILKADEETPIDVSKIYPDLKELEESSTALRKVALTLRLVDILSNARDEEWEALHPLALQLGLANEKQELVPGRYRDFAVEQWKKLNPGREPALLFVTRPKGIPAAPSKADLIKGILDYKP